MMPVCSIGRYIRHVLDRSDVVLSYDVWNVVKSNMTCLRQERWRLSEGIAKVLTSLQIHRKKHGMLNVLTSVLFSYV